VLQFAPTSQFQLEAEELEDLEEQRQILLKEGAQAPPCISPELCSEVQAPSFISAEFYSADVDVNTMAAMPSSVSTEAAVAPIIQNVPLPALTTPTETTKRIRAKREIYNSIPEVKVPARFKIGDMVMTKEGAAIVHGIDTSKGTIKLTWPKHHSALPSAIYNMPIELVWTQAEKPDQIYDSRGNRLHESNNIEWKRVQVELVDPNDVIGKVPADEIILPKSYSDKWTSVYLNLINEAEDAEWKSLTEKHMWHDPVPKHTLTLEQQKSVLRLNWLYKAKCDASGMLSRIKARLVADGSREQGTLPAGDVYTPVMSMTTVRAMLITGLQNELTRFHQLDVESAYATANCTRVIHTYYPQGKGPVGGNASNSVLRLRKALNGVVDAGRNYYDEWVDFHLEIGFQPIHQDRCYLQYYISTNEYIRLCFHVDDNILSQAGESLWTWYQQKLATKYKFKVEPLTFCMGVEFAIDYESGSIRLTQTNQIDRMLREFNHTNITSTRSPVHTTWQPDLSTIEPNPSPTVRAFPMMGYIGHLNCLQQGTRPDITRALKIASKFAKSFGEVHIRWVKHIVRYLAGTRTLGITFKRVAPELRNVLQTWTDATHASDPDCRKSISGITIKLGGNLLLWKANFQKIVSHSSTESELMALDTGATLSQYTKWVCMAMGIAPILPIPIYIDNSSAIDISSNPIQPGRNVHVHARYFYVRDLVLTKENKLVKIHTDDQVSDVLVTFKTYDTFARLRTLLLNCAYCEMVDGQVTWITTYID
jgi:hypothetical protein